MKEYPMIFRTILWLLSACGRHARILLPLGVVIALVLPSNSGFFKPATRYSGNFGGCAFVRLDISSALKAALRPQRLLRNFAISLGLLLVLPILLFTIVKWCGMPEEMLPLITWYSVAPPVSNDMDVRAIRFHGTDCDGDRATDKSPCSIHRPFLGEFLLGASVPVSSATLCLRILAILGSGLISTCQIYVRRGSN